MTDLGSGSGLSAAGARLVEQLLRRPVRAPPEEVRPRVSEGTRVPLSPAQSRIWFLSKLFSGSAEYNVFETVHLEVAPTPGGLEAALLALMARHDALRLRIGDADGEPYQETCAGLRPPVEWHDLSSAAPADAEDGVRAIGSASARRPLSTDEAPLFRVAAVRTPGGGAVLVLVFHHVVVDYWSTSLLLEELTRLLGGAALPPHPGSGFLDYLAWEAETVDAAREANELAYWREKLGGELPVLDLPADRPRPAAPTRAGRAVPLSVEPAVLDVLRRFAADADTTLFTVVLAAYKTFLLRLTRQTDLVVGTPLAGRDHPAAEALVGCFVRTVALRTGLDGAPSFREVVRRVHATVMEALDHQRVPYDRVVSELRLPREISHSPVFQTFFGLQTASAAALPGAVAGLALLESESAKWDLTVSLTETADRLEGFLEYSSDLFDEATALRYAATYLRLAAALAADPAAPVSRHPLTSAAERERILEGLNPYAHPGHSHRTMAEPFEAQARRTPEALALVGEEGTRTYAELNAGANRLAHFLRAQGAGPGVLVALCADRSFALVEALYGIVKSGAAYVPLDPELPDARIAFMLHDTVPLLVLADRRAAPRIPEGPWRVVTLEDDCPSWAHLSAENLACEVPSGELVHVLYTSGSTGRPKGVAYPVDGAIADILWLQRTYPFAPGDANVFKTSFGFDVSIWEIFWPLYFGARLVVCRPGGERDPRHLVELVERHGVTTLFLIPTLMQVFLDELPAGSCRSLRWVFCGGEPVTPRIRDGFHARLGASLINCYGPTEAGCVTDMVLEPDPGAPVVPLGRPAANFRAYVLDDEGGVAPIGVPGELYIGGEVGLAHGYFRRAALTAERFLPDPFSPPGARMYRTGDVCRYREDGVLEHRGRIGRQVKVRGVRIELAEVEAVLCEHPGVDGCVVLKVDGADPRLVAFVVAGAGAGLDPYALADHAARILPRHMVPSEVVPVDRIPTNVNGKADHATLLGAWAVADRPPAREAVPPEGEREQALAGLFAGVLGLPSVGATDSFFELGGHSLLIFKLIAACAREMQVRPSVADVFAAPTVRELAAKMESALGDPGASLVPLAPRPGLPVVVFVHAASGSPIPFFDVVRNLGDFSVYGLQVPDDDSGYGSASVEHLAARYVEAVDAVRGMSPLALVGWSMGGCVALEMARLWRARDVEVAALVMLDTWVPPSVLASPAAQAQARAAILEIELVRLEGLGAAEVDHAPEMVERLARIFARNRDAFLEYVPEWFDGEVVLLRAAEAADAAAGLPGEYAAADHGWRARVARVEAREVAGDHATLLGPEHAAALAATIREVAEARMSFSEI